MAVLETGKGGIQVSRIDIPHTDAALKARQESGFQNNMQQSEQQKPSCKNPSGDIQ